MARAACQRVVTFSSNLYVIHKQIPECFDRFVFGSLDRADSIHNKRATAVLFPHPTRV
jgi:hypothetical protein